MTDNGLLNQQYSIMANAARTALDEGDPARALLLAGRVGIFLQNNLITIMDVFCTSSTEDLRTRALILFKQHLTLCVNINALIDPVLWMRSSNRRSCSLRADSLAKLRKLIDERRRILEPGWDGVWSDPNFEIQNVLKTRHPEEVFDQEMCLDAGAQTAGESNPWLTRYLSLGGDPENPKYLKIVAANAAFLPSSKKPSEAAKQALQRYIEIAPIHEVRRFFGKITPTEGGKKARYVNPHMGRYALLLYCKHERLVLELEDWVHIAQSALYLKEAVIQRIAQRALASLDRTPAAQEVFEKLWEIHGPIETTSNPLADIGPSPNPVWTSVYNLLPVDANARDILFSYAKEELTAHR